MNIDSIKELIEPAIDSLLAKLNGLYKEHVSDQFIKVYISDKFVDIYQERPEFGIENIAYKSCQLLFEIYLEYGCKVRKNGHHTAQLFCEQFTDEIKAKFELAEELTKQ